MPEPEDVQPIARRVIFRGCVQGVGFRYTTRRIASRHDVTGYVKNLRDGTVELVAQGSSAVVDQFIADIEREMAGYVTDRTVAELPVDPELSTAFSIRY